MHIAGLPNPSSLFGNSLSSFYSEVLRREAAHALFIDIKSLGDIGVAYPIFPILEANTDQDVLPRSWFRINGQFCSAHLVRNVVSVPARISRGILEIHGLCRHLCDSGSRVVCFWLVRAGARTNCLCAYRDGPRHPFGDSWDGVDPSFLKARARRNSETDGTFPSFSETNSDTVQHFPLPFLLLTSFSKSCITTKGRTPRERPKMALLSRTNQKPCDSFVGRILPATHSFQKIGISGAA